MIQLPKDILVMVARELPKLTDLRSVIVTCKRLCEVSKLIPEIAVAKRNSPFWRDILTHSDDRKFLLGAFCAILYKNSKLLERRDLKEITPIHPESIACRKRLVLEPLFRNLVVRQRIALIREICGLILAVVLNLSDFGYHAWVVLVRLGVEFEDPFLIDYAVKTFQYTSLMDAFVSRDEALKAHGMLVKFDPQTSGRVRDYNPLWHSLRKSRGEEADVIYVDSVRDYCHEWVADALVSAGKKVDPLLIQHMLKYVRLNRSDESIEATRGMIVGALINFERICKKCYEFRDVYAKRVHNRYKTMEIIVNYVQMDFCSEWVSIKEIYEKFFQ